MVFFLGAYRSLPDAAIWWCLRTGGGGVLTRSLPVLQFPFTRVAISLAMSSSEQEVPTSGNMASNLVMVDVIVFLKDSNGAGTEAPGETWERLLT